MSARQYQYLLGDQLRTLRRARQIPQRRFAQDVGLDPSYYSRIESGKAHPAKRTTIEQLAIRLGIEGPESIEWLDLVFRADLAAGRVPIDLLENQSLAPAVLAFFIALRRVGTATR